MSESIDCPYCGAKVQTDRVLDSENKVRLRCRNCGGIFEYLPGFGPFSLPDEAQRGSIRYEGSMSGYGEDDYEPETSWGTERPQQGNCGNACGAFFCFCVFIFILAIVLSTFLGFGIF